MAYKIIFDNGKPYEIKVNNEVDLEKELKRFYDNNKEEGYFNAEVYNEKGEDISESQLVEDIISKILNEVLIWKQKIIV